MSGNNQVKKSYVVLYYFICNFASKKSIELQDYSFIQLVTFKTNDSRSEFTKQVQFNSKGIENFLS